MRQLAKIFSHPRTKKNVALVSHIHYPPCHDYAGSPDVPVSADIFDNKHRPAVNAYPNLNDLAWQFAPVKLIQLFVNFNSQLKGELRPLEKTNGHSIPCR